MRHSENELAAASFRHQRSRGKGLRGFLSRRLPRTWRESLKYGAALPLDAIDVLFGRQKELTPPRRLNYAGDGDFEATGDEFVAYFTRLGGLKPTDRVLEVGCGVGRMARPLTEYLKQGSYEGIDIVPRGVQWCQKNITRQCPNFHFQLADVRNSMYNPGGRFDASEYRFPFPGAEFDFVFLTSVFTHMSRVAVENYLAEIARTLRPGGHCFMTLFLMNEEARALIDSGQSSLTFRISWDQAYIEDERNPERAVAFEEQFVCHAIKKENLQLQQLQYGGWCGRTAYLSYQDIVVVSKV